MPHSHPRHTELDQLFPESFKNISRGLFPLILATFFIHLLALVGPVFVSIYYDLILPNTAWSSAITLVIGAIIAFSFEWLMRWARCVWVEGQATDTGKIADKKTDIYIRRWWILAQSVRGEKVSLSEISQKVSDLYALSHSSFVLPFFDIWASLIYLIAIAFMAGYLVFVPITFGIVLFIFAVINAQKIYRIRDELINSNTQHRSKFTEHINNLDQITLNGWYTPSTDYIEQGNSIQEQQSSIRKYTTDFSTLVAVFGQAQTVAVLMGGFILITADSMSAGSLFAAMILSGKFLGVQGGQLNILNTIARYYDSHKFLKNFVNGLKQKNLETPRNMVLSNFAGHIIFKKVGIDYDDVYVFRDADLTINSGDKIAIIGASGCGKSTLLKLIAGLTLPSEGQILYDNVPHTQIDQKTFFGRIGLQLQYPVFFSGTIASNFARQDKSVSANDIMKYLEKFRFCDFVTKSALGILQPIATGGRNFSAGQRQALSIARLLHQNPEIILMDEPTNGLHADARTELMNVLQEEFANKTIIFATHDPEFIKIANRVISIENGKIQEGVLQIES